jgi:hypothetical protein
VVLDLLFSFLGQHRDDPPHVHADHCSNRPRPRTRRVLFDSRTGHRPTARVGAQLGLHGQSVQVGPRPPGLRSQARAPQVCFSVRRRTAGFGPCRLADSRVRADPVLPTSPPWGRKLLSAAAAGEEAAAAAPAHGAGNYFVIVASMAVTTRLHAGTAIPVCSHAPFDPPHRGRPGGPLSRHTQRPCDRGGVPDQ